MFNLKEVRNNLNITQQDVSDILDIPLRTIESWEANKRTPSRWVQNLVLDKILSYDIGPLGIITETKGIYYFDQIVDKIMQVLYKYEIIKIIIFGSYSRNEATPISDIDILIDTNISGIDFFGLYDDIKNKFVKKVDLIRLKDVKQNTKFFDSIIKEGIVIYEQKS
jgi:hypothetical protein